MLLKPQFELKKTFFLIGEIALLYFSTSRSEIRAGLAVNN